MTPEQLKNLRHSFDFTQTEMSKILGIKHMQNYQAFEKSSGKIPIYISHYALSLTLLNENKLLKKHIEILRIEI